MTNKEILEEAKDNITYVLGSIGYDGVQEGINDILSGLRDSLEGVIKILNNIEEGE